MAETIGYRSVVVAQSGTWLVSRILRAYFAVELHRPAGAFENGAESCLILAPMHTSMFDPFLIMGALRYRHWRALVPVRTLASQTFLGPLRWFLPLVRLLYRAEGVIELPPMEEGGTLPEKVQGLRDALLEGDVVAIFPEGNVRKEPHPAVGEFAPGVVYLQRVTGADIMPIALWTNKRLRPRSRYVIEIGRPVQIPQELDIDAGAAWLRDRTLELYERARKRGEANQ